MNDREIIPLVLTLVMVTSLAGCTYTVVRELGPGGEVARELKPCRYQAGQLVEQQEAALQRGDLQSCIRAGRIYRALFPEESNQFIDHRLAVCLLGRAAQELGRGCERQPRKLYAINSDLREIVDMAAVAGNSQFLPALAHFIELAPRCPRCFYSFVATFGKQLVALAKGQHSAATVSKALADLKEKQGEWWQQVGAEHLVNSQLLTTLGGTQ
mgnify:CR=1 FL=1